MSVSPDPVPNIVESKTVTKSAEIAGFGMAGKTGQSLIPAAAMAAGLVLGALLVGTLGVGTEVHSEGGTLLAQGNLAHVLSTALVSEQTRAMPARVGPSFWSKNGSFCRTFVTRGSGPNALAGIACRERSAWHIPILTTIDARDSGEFSVAGVLPPSVRSVMDDLMVGTPLDVRAEMQARTQAWRPK